MSLTLSSSSVYCSSIELPHAIHVFKHKFLRKWLSVLWWESVMWVLPWLRSSIWSFAVPQEKEISPRTTLQSFSWVEMDTLGTKGAAVCFCKSVEFPKCFDDLELVKLFRTISYINAQVGKSILSCLAHKIRLLIFTKLPKT